MVLENYASAALQLNVEKYYLQHFYGDWINEMRNEEVLLPQGIHRIESKLGTRATNFDLPSFLLSVDKPATEDEGTVIAGTLAWSGNFKLTFEKVKYSEDLVIYFKAFLVSTTILLHIIWLQAKNLRPHHSSIPLRRKVKVKQVVIYTNGLWTTVSRKGREKRTTLLNNWEATYFDFDEKKLDHMFGDAKNLELIYSC